MLLFLLATILLAAALYAHYRLGLQAATAARVWLARLVLIIAGLAFGYVMVVYYVRNQGIATFLIFLCAFGLAHVPAAIVLWLKEKRGEVG